MIETWKALLILGWAALHLYALIGMAGSSLFGLSTKEFNCLGNRVILLLVMDILLVFIYS